MLLALDEIKVRRGDRQRQKVGLSPESIRELADSFTEVGQIQPVIVNQRHELIAGERRYLAAQLLEWETIEVKFLTDLTKSEEYLIELEENVKRVELDWPEHVEAVKTFHKLKQAENPEWTNIDSALALGLSPKKVSKDLQLANALEQEEQEETSDIRDTKGYNAAYAKQVRKKERTREASLDGININLGVISTGLTRADVKKKQPQPYKIVQADFKEWIAAYEGPKFSFIHCDFPYGIDAHKPGKQEKEVHENYMDDEATFASLVEALRLHRDRFVSENCHVMFWTATKNLAATTSLLADCGFQCHHTPLIWFKSDGKGICPDPRYAPRHCYETAILATRGKRQLSRSGMSDIFPHRVVNQLHKSEKPYEMLKHFFTVFIDDKTRVLDPTCGCGNSIRAAKALKAHSAVGVELNDRYFDIAARNIGQHRPAAEKSG